MIGKLITTKISLIKQKCINKGSKTTLNYRQNPSKDVGLTFKTMVIFYFYPPRVTSSALTYISQFAKEQF